MLPSPSKTSRRFSSLAKLDVGESTASQEWLGTLRGIRQALPNIKTLLLRPLTHETWNGFSNAPENTDSLGARLTPFDLIRLTANLPLTSLGLSGCKLASPLGTPLDILYGQPLTHLDLHNCIQLTDESLEPLQGMPLTSLDLKGCFQLEPAALEHLRGLPLTHLDLGSCYNSLVSSCPWFFSISQIATEFQIGMSQM